MKNDEDCYGQRGMHNLGMPGLVPPAMQAMRPNPMVQPQAMPRPQMPGQMPVQRPPMPRPGMQRPKLDPHQYGALLGFLAKRRGM